MKHLLYMIITIGITICSVDAQTISENNGAYSVPYLSPQLNIVNTACKSGIEVFGKSKDEQGSSKKGIVPSLVMISGGAILFAVGQIRGEEAYEKYKKSAFTDNTDELHPKVHLYSALRIAGGIMGGAGIVVLAFSF